MKLNIISGFLGSGKTTLVIKLAQKAIEKKLKTAILVNEIGDVGIDDQFMKKTGLNVWEILGGCICCTLATGILETIEQLNAEYQPDVVFLEPSGVADLKQIDQILDRYPDKDSMQQNKITVVDPLRLKMFLEVMTPLITSQIESAQTIIISKQDEASPSQMTYARQTIEKINPAAAICAITNESLPENEFLEMLL